MTYKQLYYKYEYKEYMNVQKWLDFPEKLYWILPVQIVCIFLKGGLLIDLILAIYYIYGVDKYGEAELYHLLCLDGFGELTPDEMDEYDFKRDEDGIILKLKYESNLAYYKRKSTAEAMKNKKEKKESITRRIKDYFEEA